MEHPVPKVASPTLSHLLFSSTWRLNFLLPEIVLELVSHPPASSSLPTSLLLSNLLSLLWYLCFSLSLYFLACTSVFISRLLCSYSHTSLCFFTFVLFSVGLTLMFSEKHTEVTTGSSGKKLTIWQTAEGLTCLR